MSDWDTRFIGLAKEVSTWSKDPSSKVGAVIVRPDKTICSLGFNGFPRGIADDERLLDRQRKYDIIIHAEENAIISAKEDMAGYSLYVYPYPPCCRCAARIIQSGITRIIFPGFPWPARWVESFQSSLDIFSEAGIECSAVKFNDNN